MKLLKLALVAGMLTVGILLMAACAPAAAPTPTATTKPAAAPTTAAPAAPAATPTAAAKPAEKPASLSLNAGLVYAKIGFHVSTYWVSIGRGIFAKNGLETKLTDLTDPTLMINSLGKDIDFASPSPQVVVQAYKSGRTDLRVIGSFLNSTLIQFVVLTNSPIKAIQDLKGKKIGITLPGGSCHVGALLMLKEAGIKPEEVTFITGGGMGELWTAAKTGQTDVACQIPPTSAIAVTNGEARYLWKMGERVKPSPQESVLATTTDVIKNKREALQRLVNSFVETDQWIEANREEAGKVFAQQIGIPEKIGVAVETEDSPKGAYSPAILQQANQAVEDTMKLGNVIESSYKIPWTDFVDTSFLPQALR